MIFEYFSKSIQINQDPNYRWINEIVQ